MDLKRVEALLGEIEDGSADPRALEAVEAVLELHGEALARIVERVDASALAGDELIDEVLELHGLGPSAAAADSANGVKPQVLQLPVAGQEPPEQPELCELCGSPVPPDHRHLLDLRNRELMCACQPCRILFDSGAAGGEHYRLLPGRRPYPGGFRVDDAPWGGVLIPLHLAFFFPPTGEGQGAAYY